MEVPQNLECANSSASNFDTKYTIIESIDIAANYAHQRCNKLHRKIDSIGTHRLNALPPYDGQHSWWRHHMETFSALLAIFAGNSPVTGEFPVQRPVTRSFDVFFVLRLNKRLSKQSWNWCFEAPSHPLWRHYNIPRYMALDCAIVDLMGCRWCR